LFDSLRVVGFCGLPGSGKDTAAELLRDLVFESKVHQQAWIPGGNYTFASQLKHEASIFYNLGIEYFYDRDLKDLLIESIGKTPRDLLKEHGEFRRSQAPDYWVEPVRQTLVDVANWNHEKPRLVTLSDVRRENEERLVRETYGNLVMITRPGTNSSTHPSDQDLQLLKPDYIIQNDGSLQDLMQKLRDVVSVLPL
jgi:hypothetical protein